MTSEQVQENERICERCNEVIEGDSVIDGRREFCSEDCLVDAQERAAMGRDHLIYDDPLGHDHSMDY